ncbi:MAG: oligoendopeptidase F [Candidatus Eisenbacteria bacterium]|nr:oligoendopeptidase F [Candidatus Eisenbacteria bacterium]
MIRLRSSIAACLLLLLAAGPLAAAGDEGIVYYESRSEIPLKYQWSITDIFPSVEAFNDAFGELEARVPGMETYKGRLGESPETLAAGLGYAFDLIERLMELQVYSGQYRDMDTDNAEANELNRRFDVLAARVMQAVSFLEAEIAMIPSGDLDRFRADARVKTYDHYIDNIARKKAHYRSAEVEEVLASASLLAGAPYDAYAGLVYTDIEWPVVTDENGEEMTVSPALYYSFVSKQDRRVRRDAALALFGAYSSFANTFASTFNGQVQRNLFYARNRGFERAIDQRMFEDNIPYEVIETLVGTVHDNYPAIHRYAALRKEILGVDEFHVYDLYVSLVPDAERTIGFDEAYDMALDFWKKTYGDEYYRVAKKARDERWIDVYAAKGKRGGAYSWGSYNSHPYLLLNWGGTLEDVFTLVHEMGHSIHTYLTNENQPFHDSEYSSFVAEVAAVASEALFLDYMLEKTDDDAERLYLLNMYMGNITGTFLRQIFFHEFEERAHAMAERGEALTEESLGNLYADLWKDYYGPGLVLDDEFRAGWARIPHFYRTFYVWNYATSFAAGEAIAGRVRAGDRGAVDDYIAMLKLGGSVYPMDALRRGGVEMTDPKVIQTVMIRYEETLDKMTELLRKRKG